MNRTATYCQCGNHAFAPTSSWGVTLVDRADGWLLDFFVWTLTLPGSSAYAWCRQAGGYLHHLVLPPAFGKQTDHKNGNGLDNRDSNLRHASQSQNLQNQRKNRRVHYKGVHRRHDCVERPYRARIHAGGKDIYLGQFETEIEAAAAYNAAAVQHFGEFARLNDLTAPPQKRGRAA